MNNDRTVSVSTFKPSEYQEAIFDWVENGRGDAMVSAVAGSGKTTTLVEVGKRIHSRSALFCAFNKHIAEELGRRLTGTTVQAKTVHSIGYGMLYKMGGPAKKIQLNDHKYEDIAGPMIERMPEVRAAANSRAMQRNLTSVADKLCRLSRLTLCYNDPERIEELAYAHGVELDNGLLKAVIALIPAICDAGVKMAETQRIVDFTDMLWLPIVLDLPAPRFDWVLVDEAQDLSACQRELVLKLRAPGGRMIFVGDPHQAIMGFAGADFNSYRAIQVVTDAIELPLSICYRCPTSHIELAQVLVPEIEALDGATEGTINSIDEQKLLDMVAEGDLILSRTTAPLVSKCIQMIMRKIPARVRGRDIAKQLTGIAKKAGEGIPWDRFLGGLDAYKFERLASLQKRRNAEGQIQALLDIVEALESCYVEFKAVNLVDLCAQIEGIFSDDAASIWLSTVHRAKGLEADRVFIMKPEKLPLVWQKQTDEQFAQEQNLKYVALTRSKSVLTWVYEELPAEVEQVAMEVEA